MNGRRHLKHWFLGLAPLLGAMALGEIPSFAATAVLKMVQVNQEHQVELAFDRKISKSQIRTDFFNDVVQISLNDASVYPAKIFNVNGSSLIKVFAYQYAPKLVRCRLSIRGRAEDFRNRLSLSTNGKILNIRLSPLNSDKITSHAAQAEDQVKKVELTADDGKVQAQPAEQSRPAPGADADGRAKNEASPPSQDMQRPSVSIANARETGRLTGGAPLANVSKVYGKLAAVLVFFLLIAFALKRIKAPSLNKAVGASFLSRIGQFAHKSFGKRETMIEVLSNHYLGPKKSISVIRVAGRVLVLGISNESINLITQLTDQPTEPELDGFEGLDFPDLDKIDAFPQLKVKPMAKSMASGPKAAGSGEDVRTKIRRRLEGFKQL